RSRDRGGSGGSGGDRRARPRALVVVSAARRRIRGRSPDPDPRGDRAGEGRGRVRRPRSRRDAPRRRSRARARDGCERLDRRGRRRAARHDARDDLDQQPGGTRVSWQTKTSRTVYENPWIRVREDEVVRPDGSDGIFGVVDLQNEAAFVVALDDDDRVLLVHIDRYTVGSSWEVISGGTDGEDPL